jgi:MipA family protein
MPDCAYCYTDAVKTLSEKRCHLRYGLLLLSMLCFGAKAQPVQSCNNPAPCVAEQTFSLSLALGYGQRSNPLYGGSTLPLILLPDVYYYAEHWFFDNGKLGTSWALNEQWQLSIVSQLNQEKGYFQKWYSGNAFQLSQSLGSPSFAAKSSGPMQASVQEISKRPAALDAGLQLDWFGEQWQVQSLLWQDISNTYQGQHASIGASRVWQSLLGNWQLGAKLQWKSAKLIDTYYGIDNNEPFYLPRYNAKPGWQPELRLSWQRPISERVALLAFIRYLHLDDAMTNSPLVRSNNVTTWFFGVSYRLY